MKFTQFKEKYPVWSLELDKNEAKYATISEIISHFKERIDAHPIAVYISVFNHYEHTKSIPEHSMVDGLTGLENIIFCFGKEIPTTKVAAIRPRSIAVCEFGDKFVIEFMEAPNEKLNETMQEWAKEIIK